MEQGVVVLSNVGLISVAVFIIGADKLCVTVVDVSPGGKIQTLVTRNTHSPQGSDRILTLLLRQ